jgi:hypothetical protein
MEAYECSKCNFTTDDHTLFGKHVRLHNLNPANRKGSHNSTQQQVGPYWLPIEGERKAKSVVKPDFITQSDIQYGLFD